MEAAMAVHDIRHSSEQFLRIVFVPEEIRLRTHDPREGLKLIAHIEERGYVYTTGRLEWALNEGHDIYVITPQAELRPEDAWWIERLPSRDQLFLGVTVKQAASLGVNPNNHHWIQLCNALGFPTDGLTDDGHFIARLKQRGVTFGRDLKI
jgi:hypothetical protein